MSDQNDRPIPTRATTVLVVALVGLVVGGRLLRDRLGIEASVDGFQLWVADLGLIAPLLFLVLVVFRTFLALPSWLLLTAGGLVFGPWLGTLYGAVGVTLFSVVTAFAVFHGTQTGPGPVDPPTGKTVAADYVYAMEFDGDKIRHMTKIWNDAHSLQQLGWA